MACRGINAGTVYGKSARAMARSERIFETEGVRSFYCRRIIGAVKRKKKGRVSRSLIIITIVKYGVQG
jgi:hypothetical protein